MKLLTVYKLTVLSFVLGGVSVTLFALAVSTDAWLTTREKFSASMMEENQPHDMTYWILVWTGLWRFCMMTESQPDSVSCMAVSYEVQGTGRGENNALTSFTIIAVARKSVVLPVSSLILSVVAVTFTVVGNIRKDAKTLVGGVFFILSGLSLAVGMILYISAINDEVGYRVSTSKNEGEFSYAYGWSFFTAGFGFLASEMAAVVTVTLFMKRNAKFEDMARIIPGLEDKVLPDKPHHEYAFSAVPGDDQQFFCHSEQRRGKFALCGGMRNLSVTA
ncbi:voltage-dependent calcium channel gamma-7 subunit [Biomphalaria pfeifferi]|uniref:Voltage-dependent calcium channel gamma-7 subunit n=1 Tax=Biomphalaria pfeifferi TaxID=112525 RepID=A0AAD8EY82_BIOPF|nr:voltage-dependent calcium channel gamma-7 subunit [Biomphalaria pfeifferi]